MVRLTRFLELSCGLSVAILLGYTFIYWLYYGVDNLKTEAFDTHLFSFISLFSLSYALIKDAHIRIDVFSRRLSKNQVRWLRIISVLGCMFPIHFFVCYTMFMRSDRRVLMFLDNMDISTMMYLDWIWIFGGLFMVCVSYMIVFHCGRYGMR